MKIALSGNQDKIKMTTVFNTRRFVLKKNKIKSIAGRRKTYSVTRRDLESGGSSDFYGHAIPELWSLKLKARQRMDFNCADALTVAVNQ